MVFYYLDFPVVAFTHKASCHFSKYWVEERYTLYFFKRFTHIQDYIQNQLKEDILQDQISLKEYTDPQLTLTTTTGETGEHLKMYVSNIAL